MVTIPKTQKAVIFHEHNGPLSYQDVPVSLPKDDEILVNIKYSGVCHSDLHAWKGDWPSKPILPLIGGHEGAGIVVAKGSKVTNFEIGDYAGIKWINKTCLTCEFCIGGEETCCTNQEVSGYTQHGTFQQYAIADAIQAARIPSNVSLKEVAPLLCAGLTAYKAIKKAQLQQGQWIAIIGAGGGLGSYAVQYANAMGYRVIGIDGPSKKDYVLNFLEAEKFVDFSIGDKIIDTVNQLTDGGAHGVVNLSTSEKAINLGIQYVRTLGTFVLVGIPANSFVHSKVYDQIDKQFTIVGSSVGNRADTVEALDFFQRGLIKSNVEVFHLSQLEEVYQLMEHNKIFGRIVVETSSEKQKL